MSDTTDNPLRIDGPPPRSFQEWAKRRTPELEPRPTGPVQIFIGCRADGDALVMASFMLLRQIVDANRAKDAVEMKRLCRDAARMLREFGTELIGGNMSYTIHFDGQFAVDPVLTAAQCATLLRWAGERHEDVVPESVWCGWVPTDEGDGIKFTEEEMSAYEYEAWLVYIIEHYLKPWGVTLSGEVSYQGEEASDRGTLYARNNEVRDVPDVITRGASPWAGE